ncbi:MAG: AEC family transporter [Lentisphaeria bacterium]|nr:AEC family transporter [Lentisphaeria bacterium]NQZ66497.1 AEC family transporter [Lentisphaeria bacterium]
MTDTTLIIYAVLELFGMFAIGILARRLKLINDEKTIQSLNKLVILILFPMLAFSTIIKTVKFENLKENASLPLISILLIAIGTVGGLVLAKGLSKKDDTDLKRTFWHICSFNNFGFLPIVIIGSLSEENLAWLFIFNLGSVSLYWSMGIAQLGAKDLKSGLKKILSPNFITIIVSVLIVCTGLSQYVPEIVIKITSKAGNASIPLALIIIGMTLYDVGLKLFNRDVVYYTFCRLIILPVIYIWILTFLPLNNLVLQIGLIVSLMPGALTPAVLTRLYGGSPEFASQTAVVSTFFSLATIPIGFYILQYLGIWQGF